MGDLGGAVVAPAVVAAIVAGLTSGIGAALRRREERFAWLRDQRRIGYSRLVGEASRFAAELVPLIDMRERIWQEKSELASSRARLFELCNECSFLAGSELQIVIGLASDVAEDAGHRPYDDERQRRAFEKDLLDRAFAVARDLDGEARKELGLPPPAQRR